MQAMLLAAGLGTRLRPYSLVRPKPLFPVLNQPLLQILLGQLRDAGCSRIVVNAHHLAGQIEKAIAGSGALYQYEPEILGTGGSLRQALPRLRNEPLLVMNGDIFHGIGLAALYSHHIRSGQPVTMAMHDCPRFNTVTVQEGRITSFHPGGDGRQKDNLAFTGIHVVEPEIIRMMQDGGFVHSIDFYQELIARGDKVGTFRVDGAFWQDIGTPEDYLALHKKLLTGSVNQTLMPKIPDGPWLVDDAALIDSSVRLSGWGCVGKARIGAGVQLRNCVVWDEAAVPEEACLENTIIIPAC